MQQIAIIGGGIGGLTLTNCLQHYGISYHVFESAESFSEVGAGIGISESTIHLLSTIGLSDSIMQKGSFIKDVAIVDKRFNVIRKIPIENGGVCLHRSLLIDTLAEKIDKSNVSFGHKLKNIEAAASSNLLSFENGKVYEFETVVACDGINSLMRKKLFPSIKKRYSGQTCWRGIATCKLPQQYENKMIEFWGDNVRFAAIPMNDNEYYWYAAGVAEAGKLDDQATVKDDLKGLFKNYVKEVSLLIDSTKTILRNDMWDLEPGERPWHYKNVVFLGDAIHATTPNLAQGGCQAIEDAFALSKLINRYGATEKAFAAYNNLRKDKVNYIVRQSWSYGKISHPGNSFGKMIVPTLFKILPNNLFRKQYRKLIDISYLEKI